MVESIADETSTKYPSLFTGLGTFHIKPSPAAQPYALRNIPLLLYQKAQTEVERRESLGVISWMDAGTNPVVCQNCGHLKERQFSLYLC